MMSELSLVTLDVFESEYAFFCTVMKRARSTQCSSMVIADANTRMRVEALMRVHSG